jgi:hypothetical protein
MESSAFMPEACRFARSRLTCRSFTGSRLAGLPRILAEPDVDPIAVLLGGVAQQLLDIARVGPRAHQIEQVVAA